MTQTAANIFDINSNTGLISKPQMQSKDTESAVIQTVDNGSSNKFDSILDKTIEKQSFTLGDMKNSNQIGDMSEEITNFKEFLIQTTQEVNMENALSLTPAREISDIIKQLQNVTNPKFNLLDNSEDCEEIEGIEEVVTTDDSSEKITNKEEETKNSSLTIDEKILPQFEEILTYINNNETTDSQSDNISQDSQIDNTNNEQKTSYSNNILIKETSAKDTISDKSIESDSLNIDEDILNELNIESVSSESNSAEENSMQRQQSAEEYSVKIMLDNHSDKFEVNFEKATNVQNSSKASTNTSDNIIEQISKHIDSLKSNSKVNIVLNPESLGKVNLQIINSKNGLTAQLLVNTNEARELLTKGLDGLKETLLAHGVSVDNISVKVSETEEAYNPDWTEQEESERGSKEQSKQKQEEKQKGLFEKTIAENLKQENDNV